jgi:uncharacterized membrane protein
MALLIALHALGAVVWVGGMFFAHMALRPSVEILAPPHRLPLLAATLGRFFAWVWVAVALLLATGYLMIGLVFGGFADLGLHIHVMQGIGLVMMALFAHIWFVPFRRLRAAVAAGDWLAGGAQMAQIRRIVAVNLVLGLAVAVIATGGRYL